MLYISKLSSDSEKVSMPYSIIEFNELDDDDDGGL